jgi:uncharacterized protein YodC (DUF2158 family)
MSTTWDEADLMSCYRCSATAFDSFDFARNLAMTIFKSGDLVVLKSGGPTMTVDTVNTDIFDDNRITGVLCVWFVGQKLERVRFDHQAIELAGPQEPLPGIQPSKSRTKTAEDYKAVLDNMVGAMNTPPDHVEAVKAAPKRQKGSVRTEISKNSH